VHICQQTGEGVLPVEIAFHAGRPQRVTMTQKPAQFRAARLPGPALARALGLGPRDFESSLPLEYVSTGIFNLMVPLRRRALLKGIRMDMHALKKLISHAGVVAYCFALGRRGKAFARGMIPWELHEDPATGSAGGSLGAYLVRHGRLRTGESLEILQGVEMGRPSRIHVEVRSERGRPGQLVPRVSGSAVSILQGLIEA
jgi:trans-2,3-dihydro-3-hydroxyanthranilate isomerase